MEAATKERELSGEKAQRIIDAMRESVAKRGAAGSTFERVAREAGVSRGLLHYYFGTKERLLAEVVRHDSDLRISELEARLGGARRGAAPRRAAPRGAARAAAGGPPGGGGGWAARAAPTTSSRCCGRRWSGCSPTTRSS